MAASKVYFTNFRATPKMPLLKKFRTLLEKAGMTGMELDGKFTAIKIHFGESGNLAHLRPQYAKVLVDTLKEMGARPFLTDSNTLYVGSRRNALDHLTAAYENGFSPFQTGCHAIIADGLMGTDDVAVPVDGEYCKEALIGRAIMDAEAVITLNHFKCHEATGIGGALKNLGMGCGSTAGKRAMHHEGKPTVQRWCVGCGRCVTVCAHNAISMHKYFNEKKGREMLKAEVDHDKCTGCARCVGICRDRGAILGPDSANDVLNCKISEYAWAVIKDRPNFHVTLVCDVSPYCDCHQENDSPIIADVGMFASFDPVALDKACADACNRMEPLPGTFLAEKTERTGDVFNDTHPYTNWRSGVEHAAKLGVGSLDYELIEF